MVSPTMWFRRNTPIYRKRGDAIDPLSHSQKLSIVGPAPMHARLVRVAEAAR
jgi:hypothetical protein